MFKRITAALLALVCALALASSACAATNAVETGKHMTVYILAFAKTIFGDVLSISGGSGFAVGTPDEPVKYFVTNRHVTNADEYAYQYQDKDGATHTRLPEMTYFILFDNYLGRVPAYCVCESDRTDLALLRIDEPTDKRTACRLRLFTQDISGETVTAIGFPADADSAKLTSVDEITNARYEDMSVNVGAVQRVLEADVNYQGAQIIQIDLKINHGNSGGPLVDESGNVIGVNTGSSNGVNYAISSNEVARMLREESIPFTEATDAQADGPTDGEPDVAKQVTDAPVVSQPTAAPVVEGEKPNVALIVGIAVLALAVLAVGGALLVQARTQRTGDGKAHSPSQTATRTLVSSEGKRYTLERKTVVGRDSNRCKIVLPKGTAGVSAVHCTIRFQNGKVTVTDENSSYGTSIDSTRLKPGQPTVMHRGQTLYLGSHKTSFTLHS